MKLILETGVQDEIECPYCGYSNAFFEYESRGHRPDNHPGSYENYSTCPICGWEEYADEEDEEKSNPLTTEKPEGQQLKNAKTIAKIAEKILDFDFDFTDAIWQRNPHNPQNDEHEFKIDVIHLIFKRT